MSLPTPRNDAKEDNLDPTSQIAAEELDVSKAVAASLDYAQLLPSKVSDHANWSPKSREDWEIYERQFAAIGEAVASKDDPHLQAAIKSSMEEHEIEKQKEKDLQWDRLLDGEDVSTEKGKSPIVSFLDEKPGRPSLEDRIQDLSLKVHLELPILYDPHGDTHIYIDPPTQQPEQDGATYAHYTERYKFPMLMKKQTLLSFNSPFFENMFGSTYQYRILRRRGLVGKLPEHVKYVIDLTPPAEGDEAVYLMTELCCSEGVRKWFLANQRWQVSKSLIGGEDEYMPSFQGSKLCTTNVTTSGLWTDGVGYNPSPGFLNSQGVLVPLPLDYTPVRHRSSIERVLAAAQGFDPHLDSAPKVWTTFAVAKYFSLTHTPLTDYIVRWLRSFPNSYFLEVNPEISLKIADGLQCHDLCRDIFAILVGEEALATTRRYDDRAFGIHTSVYGRKREDLLESYQTRIEYASKAFIERVSAEFISLVDQEMSWFESVPEFSKLAFDGPLSIDAANQLLPVRSMLKVYVRGAIYKLLSTNYKTMPNAVKGLFRDDHLFPSTSWESVWKTLPPRERILTRSFWEAIQICDIFLGPTNLDIGYDWENFDPTAEITDSEMMFSKKGLMKMSFIEDIEQMVARLHHRSSFNSQKAPDGSKGSFKSFWRKMHRDQVNSPPTNLTPDASDPSPNFTPDTNLESGSDDGEKVRSKFADGPPSRVTFDHVSEAVPEDEVFEHGFQNASTENRLPIQQKQRSYSDSAQVNTLYHLQQASVPSPSMAHEADGKHVFNLHKFFAEAMTYLRAVATHMLEPPDSSVRTQCLELGLTNTLVSLTDAEWKYLPLWAGGNDDDSGGVFNDDIPLSYDGFSTAGPNVRTGSGSSSHSSETTLGVTSLNTFTRTSLQNNDGYSDTLPKGKVVSADEGGFSSSDDISMLDDGDPSSDKSIVLIPSINGSSITFDSDHTMITPSESENDDENKERQASGLVAETGVEESDNRKDKFSDVEESDDTFDFIDDDYSDTMDGDYDDEEEDET